MPFNDPSSGAPPTAPVPGSPPPPSGGISSLLGNQASSLPQTGPTPQEQVQAYMDQIRALHMGIDALATDHPEASEDLNTAKNALTNSMAKVATAITAPAGAAGPMTF